MDEKNNVQYVLFGCGVNFYSYLERLRGHLEIRLCSDNNENILHKYNGRYGMKSILPSEIAQLDSPYVIIAADREGTVAQIKEQFQEMGIPCAHALDMIRMFEYTSENIQWPQEIHRDRIFKFIDIALDETTSCNFKCKYCYVWRKKGFEGKIETSSHSVQDIRNGLTKEKLGGVCFINLCAHGETLLSQDIVELVRELLSEGHYVSVVTNGTIRKNILKILEFAPELQERFFFKISFHYHELLEKNLMDTFWENVRSIRASRCSYTLEITPYDDLVKDIDDIKQLFEEKENGALPHISFARDSKKDELDVLSDLPIEEYNKIWGQFDSKMFALKSQWYGKKIDKFCYAGNWSYRVNASNGSIQNCYRNESIGNIFDNDMKGFPISTIAHECKMAYCFNNHAFLAWGCVPEITGYSYLDMRDRVRADGSSWISDKMRMAMDTKLDEEHFQFAHKWSDYEKLYHRTARPAIILFNSPDYRNLGDHAIALAERKFFEENYRDYDFIEVSCEEYIKENTQIRNFIREDDIIAITGGGNFGTLWLWIYDLILNIIQTYKQNKIVILPQSIYFEDTPWGMAEAKRTKKIFKKHGDVTLYVRDKMSYQKAESLFGEDIEKVLVPDMAFYLRCDESNERQGIAVALRADKEALGLDLQTIENELKGMGELISLCSTIAEQNVFLDNRENEVERFLQEISKYKVVVTDRLHGMIFCAITKTPCVVFDNSYKKVSGVYEWLKELPYIQFCEDISQLQEKVSYVLKADTECNDILEKLRKEIKISV